MIMNMHIPLPDNMQAYYAVLNLCAAEVQLPCWPRPGTLLGCLADNKAAAICTRLAADTYPAGQR